MRQLHRQLGELPEVLREQVRRLPLGTLKTLGEALFDFEAIADLQSWLEQQAARKTS